MTGPRQPPMLKGMARSQALIKRNTQQKELVNRRQKLVHSKKEFDEKLKQLKPVVVNNPNPSSNMMLEQNGLKEGPSDLRNLEELGQSVVWKKWTDARHVEHVLMRGDFDNNFIVNAIKGREVLLYNGHLFDRYVHHRTVACPTDDIINRWVCNQSYTSAIKGNNCPTTLVTTLNNECLLMESIEAEHNHKNSVGDKKIYNTF